MVPRLMVCAVAVLSLTASASASAQEWKPPLDVQKWRTVLKSASFAMSYERRTVERYPREIYKLWVRRDYRDPQTLTANGTTLEYTYTTQFSEFDCPRTRYRTGSRFLLDADDREVMVDRSRLPWQEVHPESVDGQFFEVVCAEIRRRYGGQ